MSIMSFIRLNRFQKKRETEGTGGMAHNSLSSFLMPSPIFATVFALLLLFAAVTECSGPGVTSNNLEVWVWDHREAINDFSELRLTLSAVAVHPAGQRRTEGWIELELSVTELDLTQYVEGEKALIVQTTVMPGHYDAVWLTVDQVKATLKNGQPATLAILLEPVALDFRVDDGRITSLGFDLVVLDLSDHPGQGYELHVRESLDMGN